MTPAIRIPHPVQLQDTETTLFGGKYPQPEMLRPTLSSLPPSFPQPPSKGLGVQMRNFHRDYYIVS